MPEDLVKARDLFLHAVGRLPPAEWDAYVAGVCGGDAELQRQVAALLRAHREAGSFLDRPAAGLDGTGAFPPGVGTDPPPPERVGTAVGPYKLLQQIGEGGMGTVWMAEQSHPVRRTVALKVIKAGMDSRSVVARFEAERQALAVMDHVNIARVFDAGATDAGRPYFVMELVHGVPVTKFCDDHHLTPRQRLELFVPVCQAIQHAHQKGVIHRDVKPSNVMVTLSDGKPVPKVIDFGVAKATDQSLTERTLFTEHGALVGTLEYMSPEQAETSALGVDTRSDIYSLGVLLYELLTGSTPLDRTRLREAGYGEILRRIKEEEPPRPSTRLGDSGEALASISACRRTEPAKLTRLLRGELDWIVMKSLEKDRNRRYDTASAFAADVQRYLEGEAVSAVPPSAAYRFRKFVRRNRAVVVGSAAVVTALAAGVIGTTIGMIGQARQRTEAERQEREANKLAAVAEAVSKFQGDMFRSVSPFESGDKVTVLQVMTAAVRELDAGKLKDNPLVELNVRHMIGRTLHELGRYAEAEPVLRKAVALSRDALASPHWGVASCIQSLAVTLMELGRLEESEALMREALQIRRAVRPPGHPDLSTNLALLGSLLQIKGQYAEAEAFCREALAQERQRVPVDHSDLASSLGKLGWLLQTTGQFDEAERLCREEVDIRRRHLPAAHPDVADSVNRLAVVFARTHRLAEAEPLFREVLAIDRKSLPGSHPRVGQSLNNLATALQEQGKFAEAEPLQREGLEHRRKTLPAGHPNIAQSLKNLAVLLVEQRKYTEAEPFAREALAIRRKAMPAGHPDIAGSLETLGALLAGLGRFADGEAALLEAERVIAAVPGLPAKRHVDCVEALVRLYSAWHTAEPDKGYDAKAGQWKAKLPTPP